MRRFNWQIWAGFVLSIFAFISFPLIFAEWPLTRDFPWVNLLLCVIAAVLVIVGLWRAFGGGRSWFSKIGTSLLALLSVGAIGLFVMMVFVMARWLPESAGAPQVGAKAPDFTLTDTNDRAVSLSELLTTPIEQRAGEPIRPKGVLLVFYRGYW